MDQVAVGLARSMISALVEIGAKWLTLQLLQATVLKDQAKGDSLRRSGEAQAQVAMAGLNSYTSTAAIPVTGPALAPAAAASAMAFTEPLAAMVAAASASALTGMAHAGISSIPDEGTWLLKRRERVLAPEQNQDLTSFCKTRENNNPLSRINLLLLLNQELASKLTRNWQVIFTTSLQLG